MKKYIKVILLCVFVFCFLIGCDKEDKENEGPMVNDIFDATEVQKPSEIKKENTMSNILNEVSNISKLTSKDFMPKELFDIYYDLSKLKKDVEYDVRSKLENGKYTEIALFDLKSSSINTEASKMVSARKKGIEEKISMFSEKDFVCEQNKGILSIIYAENAREIADAIRERINK